MAQRTNATTTAPTTDDTPTTTRRRADSDAPRRRRDRRDAEDADRRALEPGAEAADYQALVGESEYSARAARGPDADLARELPVHDRGAETGGPPRKKTLSEDPEDMGARWLERTTEAPRTEEPDEDAGFREAVVQPKEQIPGRTKPRDSERSSANVPIPDRPDPDRS